VLYYYYGIFGVGWLLAASTRIYSKAAWAEVGNGLPYSCICVASSQPRGDTVARYALGVEPLVRRGDIGINGPNQGGRGGNQAGARPGSVSDYLGSVIQSVKKKKK